MWLLFLACTSGKDSGAGAGSDSGADLQEVAISFRGAAGEADFACGSPISGLGLSGATWTPLDFRLYVHDLRLLTAEGAEAPVRLTADGVWQTEAVALLDFEDGSADCGNGTAPVNAQVLGSVAPGTYTGLAFTLGVPFDLNHADQATAPSPLNLSTLFWGWQAGYKFARIDGRSGGIPDGALVHLGSTGCEADADGTVTACSRPNRAEIRFDVFDAATQRIAVDIAALFAGVDLDQDGGGAALCMSEVSDPECAAMFAALGLDADGQPGGGQAVFRVE